MAVQVCGSFFLNGKKDTLACTYFEGLPGTLLCEFSNVMQWSASLCVDREGNLNRRGQRETKEGHTDTEFKCVFVSDDTCK